MCYTGCCSLENYEGYCNVDNFLIINNEVVEEIGEKFIEWIEKNGKCRILEKNCYYGCGMKDYKEFVKYIKTGIKTIDESLEYMGQDGELHRTDDVVNNFKGIVEARQRILEDKEEIF